jgi:hypothetical protein
MSLDIFIFEDIDSEEDEIMLLSNFDERFFLACKEDCWPPF